MFTFEIVRIAITIFIGCCGLVVVGTFALLLLAGGGTIVLLPVSVRAVLRQARSQSDRDGDQVVASEHRRPQRASGRPPIRRRLSHRDMPRVSDAQAADRIRRYYGKPQ